jgi:formate dehydrogenase maturation protein FdhE
LSESYRTTIQKIQARLAEGQQPLPDSLLFYSQVLAAIARSGISPKNIPHNKKSLFARRMSKKKPALHFEDIPVDWEGTGRLLAKLTEITSKQFPQMHEESSGILAIAGNKVALKEMLQIWYRNPGNDAGVANSLLHGSIYPTLLSVAAELRDSMPGNSWNEGFCPVCGGKPDFSYLEKKHGARWLVCSRCDTEWEFYRLVCPFCGNNDHSTLSYITDEQNKYRLYLCDKCRTYLKCIDTRKTDDEILIPLERILTSSMDQQGLDKNYTGR